MLTSGEVLRSWFGISMRSRNSSAFGSTKQTDLLAKSGIPPTIWITRNFVVTYWKLLLLVTDSNSCSRAGTCTKFIAFNGKPQASARRRMSNDAVACGLPLNELCQNNCAQVQLIQWRTKRSASLDWRLPKPRVVLVSYGCRGTGVHGSH